MPVMSYATFNRGIDKWFSLRNGAIGVIDAKMKEYDRSPTNRALLLELQSAVNAFKHEKDLKFASSNGDYTNSKRDKNGTITLLSKQVDAEVDATNPGRPLGLNPFAGLAASAQVQALARQARAENDSVLISCPVTQQLDFRNGAAPVEFGWTVQLKLTQGFTELVVDVALKLKPTAAIVGEYQMRWKTHIQSSWNNAKLIHGAKQLDIRFNLVWKAVGSAEPAYEVNVHQPPPRPDEPEYVKAGGKWDKGARGPTVGGGVGTPDMGNWGADDSAAIVHEFGHMIGCPDEYYTKSFNGVPVAADIYDQLPLTTDSIMNNTGPNGRIHARHYDFIRAEYEKWKGLSAGSTTIQVKG